MTTVSVIIPTYNRASFLKRALVSVLRQTVACAEIFIIDDGSTDQTAELIHDLQPDSQVPLHYYHQNNSGPATARNAGIHLAQSELIAFLDSDDHWHKDKLAHQLTAMEAHPEFLISHTREQWYRRGQHLNQKQKHIPRQGDIFAHCLQLCAVGMSTVVARRELFSRIGLFAPSLRCCEDYDFWLRASARYPFLLIDRPLTIKEGGREDQVSFQYRVGMDKLRIQSILGLLAGGTLSTEQQGLARRELQRKCQVYGQGCRKHGKEAEAARYLSLSTEGC